MYPKRANCCGSNHPLELCLGGLTSDGRTLWVIHIYNFSSSEHGFSSK
jgi:hypothetical protein